MFKMQKIILCTIILSVSPLLLGRGESTITEIDNRSDVPVTIKFKPWWWAWGETEFTVPAHQKVLTKEATKEKTTIAIPWEEEAGRKLNEWITVIVGNKNSAKIQERSKWDIRSGWHSLDLTKVGWETLKNGKIIPVIQAQPEDTLLLAVLPIAATMDLFGNTFTLGHLKIENVKRWIHTEQSLLQDKTTDTAIDPTQYDAKNAFYKLIILNDYSVAILPTSITDAEIDEIIAAREKIRTEQK